MASFSSSRSKRFELILLSFILNTSLSSFWLYISILIGKVQSSSCTNFPTKNCANCTRSRKPVFALARDRKKQKTDWLFVIYKEEKIIKIIKSILKIILIFFLILLLYYIYYRVRYLFYLLFCGGYVFYSAIFSCGGLG